MINLHDNFSIEPDSAKFSSGEVVHHLRYDYRGLIVEFDPTCQAPENWYQSNHTQPSRNQPWYHVLVDGSHQVTYVAQSNLAPDQTGKPIVHPMLNLFFSGIDEANNRYLRNEVPWNPGQPPEAPPPLPPEEPPV